MHGLLPVPLPAILGHEGAGIVRAVGPGVTKLRAGDHVVVAAVTHCGECRACLEGKPFVCQHLLALAYGGAMPDGTRRLRRDAAPLSHFFCQSSIAEHTLVPARNAIQVPTDVPLEQLGAPGMRGGGRRRGRPEHRDPETVWPSSGVARWASVPSWRHG